MPIAWRPLLRDLVTYVVVAALLAGLGLLVWWTRHPSAESLTAIRSWPVVGSLAARFQDGYLQPSAADGAARNSGDDLEIVLIESVPEPPPPRPYLWFGAGTSLRRQPSLSAEAVHVLDAMTNLFVEERSGEWLRVRWAGVDAWVLRPRGGSTADLGALPAPVVPLPSRPPERALLARAAELMSDAPAEFRLGEFAGLADGADVDRLVERCSGGFSSLDDFYRDTLGLAPLVGTEEVLLVFATRRQYEEFAGGVFAALGHAGPGYAATFAQGRSPKAVCATLIHEAAHLLNRRAIGPALPPWLGEGIAEYVQWRQTGDSPPLEALHRARRAGVLPSVTRLVELDEGDFQESGPPGINYGASGIWIEYLMSESELRDGFRRFLLYLAAGGPWSETETPLPEGTRASPTLGDDLAYFLNSDLERLDSGFGAWLWSRS